MNKITEHRITSLFAKNSIEHIDAARKNINLKQNTADVLKHNQEAMEDVGLWNLYCLKVGFYGNSYLEEIYTNANI